MRRSYWVLVSCAAAIGAVLVVAAVGSEDSTSESSVTAEVSPAAAEPEPELTADEQPTPTASAGADHDIPSGTLIPSGVEGREYFCDAGGIELSEVFDYDISIPVTATPREMLARALSGSELAKQLDEVIRVKTVFWRTFKPLVDTTVEMDETTLAWALDFDISRTVQVAGSPAERQELRMYVEILDPNRAEKQVAGVASFWFVPDTGWLLESYDLCESAWTGGVPQPTPVTTDAYWVDAEGNIYDYDPDAVDE